MYYSLFRSNVSRNHIFLNYSLCKWAKGWKSRYERARGVLCWKINVRAEFISFFWPGEQPFLCISRTSGNHESLCRGEISLLATCYTSVHKYINAASVITLLVVIVLGAVQIFCKKRQQNFWVKFRFIGAFDSYVHI